jgi:uncharacterized protein YbaR (Trm112 family)
MSPLDPALLSLLACPACKKPLTYRESGPEALDCAACRKRYPVKDGIPVLLASEAQAL